MTFRICVSTIHVTVRAGLLTFVCLYLAMRVYMRTLRPDSECSDPLSLIVVHGHFGVSDRATYLLLD